MTHELDIAIYELKAARQRVKDARTAAKAAEAEWIAAWNGYDRAVDTFNAAAREASWATMEASLSRPAEEGTLLNLLPEHLA